MNVIIKDDYIVTYKDGGIVRLSTNTRHAVDAYQWDFDVDGNLISVRRISDGLFHGEQKFFIYVPIVSIRVQKRYYIFGERCTQNEWVKYQYSQFAKMLNGGVDIKGIPCYNVSHKVVNDLKLIEGVQ